MALRGKNIVFAVSVAAAVGLGGAACSSSGTVGGSAKAGGSSGSSGGSDSSGSKAVGGGASDGDWKGSAPTGEAVELVISGGKAELKTPHACKGTLNGKNLDMTCDDGSEDWNMALLTPGGDGKSATLWFEGQDKFTVSKQ